MESVRIVCDRVAVVLLVAGLGLTVRTLHLTWKLEPGLREVVKGANMYGHPSAYEAQDEEWLDWLVQVGGPQCRLAVETLRTKTSVHLEIDEALVSVVTEAGIRREVLGYSWLWIGVVFCAAVVLPVGSRASLFVHRRRRRLCTGCGYDLRGLRGLRCPECGRSCSVEDGDKGPLTLVSARQRRFVRAARVLIPAVVALTVVAYVMWPYWREYRLAGRIATYRARLRDAGRDPAATIQEIVEDWEMTSSTEGQRMLFEVLNDRQALEIVRIRVAEQLQWLRSEETMRSLLSLLESSTSTREKRWLIRAMDCFPCSYEAEHCRRILAAIAKEQAKDVRREMAVWLNRHLRHYFSFDCRDDVGSLSELFDSEDDLLTRVALAGAITQCDTNGVHRAWLEELEDIGTHDDQTVQGVSISTECSRALDGRLDYRD